VTIIVFNPRKVFVSLRQRRKQMQPIRIADDPAGEQDEQDEQDWSAAAPDQSPAPKTDHALQPIEQSFQQK